MILPSLLNADTGALRAQIKELHGAGATGFHLDIMDGSFVPPISFGDSVVRLLKDEGIPTIETHLMVVAPERHIETFAKAGSTRIIFHYEATNHPHRLLGAIRDLGIQSGIALNPGTPVGVVEDLLPLTDVLLLMTVNPGWGGQAFIPTSIQKLHRAKDLITTHKAHTLIEVDGGVNEATINECAKAGASLFVVGSALFKGQNCREAYRSMSGLLS